MLQIFVDPMVLNNIVSIQRNSGFGEWIHSPTDSSQIHTPFSKMSNENGSVLQFRLPLYMII